MQPDDFSRTAGALTVSLLLLAGAFNLIKKRNRPDLNTKCLWSLVLSLLGFGGARPLTLLAEPLGRAGAVLAGFLILAVFAVAVILAIKGLIELRRPSERNTGGKFAWWTLGLTVFLLGVPFTLAFLKGRADAKKARISDSWVAFPGSNVTFSDLNFRFAAPGKPWAQVNAKVVSPDASLVFTRSAPELLCIVIGEAHGADEVTTESVVELAQGQITSAFHNPKISTPGPLVINGVSGSRFEESGRVGTKEIFGVRWCASINGFAYQILVRGAKRNESEVRAQAEQLFQKFALLDSNRFAAGPEAVTAPHHSLLFHYSADFSAGNWNSWADHTKHLEGSDFGVRRGDNAYFGVMPFYLHGRVFRFEFIG